MSVAVADMSSLAMDYFEPPEKRIQLNFRVRASLKAQLQDVVRLWKIMAMARGTEPEDIDLTYVAERLLKVGVEGTWAQVLSFAGLDGMPKTDEDWTKLERAILKAAKEDARTRGR